MGTELKQKPDPKMLENLGLMIDYDNVKDEKDWGMFQELPENVFDAQPEQLEDIDMKDPKTTKKADQPEKIDEEEFK